MKLESALKGFQLPEFEKQQLGLELLGGLFVESWKVIQQTESQRKGAKEPGGEAEMSAGSCSQDAGAGAKCSQWVEKPRSRTGSLPSTSSGPGPLVLPVATGLEVLAPRTPGLGWQLKEG